MAQDRKAVGRREARVRRAVKSAAGSRVRLSVHRSSKHIYAQVIDDRKGETLAAASSLEKPMREELKTGADIAAAKAVGKLVAERALAKGVKLGFGSDAAVCPHASQVVQFADLVRLGMKPLAALRTATSADAQLLGHNELGSLEAGKIADVIAVPGNASTDITAVEKVFFVMKDGTVFRNDGKR
jgi:large subunit ribosomal protein L18